VLYTLIFGQPRKAWGSKSITKTGKCKPATATDNLSGEPVDAIDNLSEDATDSLSEQADVSAKLFFRGATTCGAVGLTLARETAVKGPVTGIEQVLQLAQAEQLIRAVEQWLRSDWDPVPCGSCDEAVHHGYQAVVRNPVLAPPGTLLHLPLKALLAPPPEILCAPAMTWAAQTADLILGNVPLPVLEQLEPGALVLLPQAFSPQWMVRLRDLSGRLPTRLARLDLTAQQLEVAASAVADTPPEAPPAQPDDEAQPLVRLVQGVPVPLDCWMGFERANLPFRWPVPQPWAAQLCCAGIVRACGALLPIGQGYGMLLESVQERASSAA